MPSAPDVTLRRALPWADVVVDLRATFYDDDDKVQWDPLPLTLPAGDATRAVQVGGWSAVPVVCARGAHDPAGASTSVLVLTAPDGWCAGFAWTGYTAAQFAFAQARSTLPLLGRVLSPGTASPATVAGWRREQEVALPVLRSALEDPDTWLAGTTEDDWDGAATEPLVYFASGGVTTGAAAAVCHLTATAVVESHAGFTGRDLLAWRTAGFDGDTETASWLSGHIYEPEKAQRLRDLGLTAMDWCRWVESRSPVAERPEVAARCHARGWTPEAVQALAGEVATNTGMFFPALAAWEAAMDPARASAYLLAGVSFAEACEIEASAPASMEVLATLAALRTQTVQAWVRVPEERVGDPAVLDPVAA